MVIQRQRIGMMSAALLVGLAIGLAARSLPWAPKVTVHAPSSRVVPTVTEVPASLAYPLTIEAQRARAYPGSSISPEGESLSGAGYTSKVISYRSDGLKIYALELTPTIAAPPKGFPVIILLHGYINPDKYLTTANDYLSYARAFASAGYVVLQPDLRGYGQSWGVAEGAYYSPGYTADVLNLVASLKGLPGINATRIGLWGHSMGGRIALNVLAVAPTKFRAGVIAAGAVGTTEDMFYHWRAGSDRLDPATAAIRQRVIKLFGEPHVNPNFWQKVSPYSVLSDIKTPLRLQVASDDRVVPAHFTTDLAEALRTAGSSPEFKVYPGGGHSFAGTVEGVVINDSLEFYRHTLPLSS